MRLMARYFNPRSPWGERHTGGSCMELSLIRFQSTLPVGGATIQPQVHLLPFPISIHAPRGGSDRHQGSMITPSTIIFQSTLPVGGATALVKRALSCPDKFQSTLPVGGATIRLPVSCRRTAYFNPRSPWGERQSALTRPCALSISIHAPRGGSDQGVL